jgi:hypothetical protein
MVYGFATTFAYATPIHQITPPLIRLLTKISSPFNKIITYFLFSFSCGAVSTKKATSLEPSMPDTLPREARTIGTS